MELSTKAKKISVSNVWIINIPSILYLVVASVPCALCVCVVPGLGALGPVSASFPVVILSPAQCNYWAWTQTLQRPTPTNVRHQLKHMFAEGMDARRRKRQRKQFFFCKSTFDLDGFRFSQVNKTANTKVCKLLNSLKSNDEWPSQWCSVVFNGVKWHVWCSLQYICWYPKLIAICGRFPLLLTFWI